MGLLLLILQSNAFRLTGLLHMDGFTPSLLLPVVVLLGVTEYPVVPGAAIAFVLGYATDLVGIAPIGLHTSSCVSIFLVARSAGARMAAHTWWSEAALAAGFTLLHDALELVLITIFGRDPFATRALFAAVGAHVAATAVAAPFVFRLVRPILHGVRSGPTGGQ